MKKLVTFALICLFISSCQSTKHTEGSLEELKSTLSSFNEAFSSGDLEYLDKHTTNNYTHTNSSSKAFGKASWFKYLRGRKSNIENGTLIMEKYEMSETDIQLYTNSAIITGKVLTKGINNQEPFERSLRVTHYWVFEEGLWKRAGFHDTRIE